MKIKQSVVLVTGANGGLGKALVAELLRRGVAKVYVGRRNEAALIEVLAKGDSRVVPVVLDVTDQAQVNAVAERAQDVTLVINNAGYNAMTGTLTADVVAGARQEMEVNYIGPLRVARAFAPAIAKAGGGTIVNVLSFLSLVTLPLMATYSASKAAALAMTRSLRAELGSQNINVLAAMPVQIDTAMGAWFIGEKIAPEEAAIGILDAVEAGEVEAFPGRLSQDMASAFKADPEALQAQLAQHLPAPGRSEAMSTEALQENSPGA
ncbi:MAG TPA: SDR family oxidoreductase [Vicinamibacterales bacterium]